MKPKLAFIIVFLALISVCPKPVFAENEAGAAGELAYRIRIPTESDIRVSCLHDFLASYNSPLADEAQTFVAEADKNNLDWKLVPAIAGVESTFGKEIPANSYNAWGWGVFTGAQDGVHFTNWADGIAQVANGLKTHYFVNGAKSVDDIGWTYAANGNSWSAHVHYFLNQILCDKPPVSVLELPVSI